MLRGCITALITPMLVNGQVDYKSLTKLLEQQIQAGVDGVVLCGSTAEAANLTTIEKIAIIKHALVLIQGRIKVVVGVGSTSTQVVLEFVDELNQITGIDYVMCVTPYYVKPTQVGLYQHFALISQRSIFPVILYNVPSRTGCNLLDDTILSLAKDCPNIVGIKDASGDIARCSYLVAKKPQDFSLLSGDDATSLAFMLAGGDGVISVVSNIRPQQMAKLCNKALSGKVTPALKLNQQLLSLYSLLFIEANPIPVKWCLFHEQVIASAELRLPLTSLSSTYHNQLATALADIQ